MRDRIEQAKIRIERDIENVQGQFKDTLEQRGELTKNLHALVVKFEEEKKQLNDKIYDIQIQEKYLQDQDMKLQAQLEALNSLG